MVDEFLVAVTVCSLSMAIVMGVITWRVIHLERRQSAARANIRPRVTHRPEEIAAAPGAPAWPPVRRDAANSRWSNPEMDRVAAPKQPAAALTQPVVSGRSGNGRYALAVGVGALALTAVVGWVLAFGGSPAAAASLSPAAARVATPLELVALAATRDNDRVTIRGTVRNPAAGSRMAQLEAVVFLFNQRGMYVGTTRAMVAQGVLVPGSESAFEIPLAAGLQVSQYRLSFRMTLAPVPHIDRRPAPEQRTVPGAIVMTRGCNNHTGSDCFS